MKSDTIMIYASIIMVIISIIFEVTHIGGGVAIFFIAAIAIIPLAGLLGKATEEIAITKGPAIGGLLNATFGNATELIIAAMALYRGYFDVVKASLTGSIIGNLLLVLGISMLAGGLKYKRMQFNTQMSSMNSSMLMLAILGLLVPAVYYYTGHTGKQDIFIIEELSIGVAAVLIIIYVAGLIFSLHTHKDIFHSKDEVEEAEWSQTKAMVLLIIATLGVALESEFLIGSLEEVVKSLGWSEIFIGVIIVAIIGNAAEHGVAVMMAMKNKIDLSLNVSLSSSTQIALFVAPVLVFLSLIFSHINGKPAMDLLFSPFEILAIFGSVYTVSFMAGDGEFNWFEGAQLLGVYIIMGVVFFFIK